MTDTELNGIADARKEIEAALRSLNDAYVSLLDSDAAANDERGVVIRAINDLTAVRWTLYRKEHGIDQGAAT